MEEAAEVKTALWTDLGVEELEVEKTSLELERGRGLSRLRGWRVWGACLALVLTLVAALGVSRRGPGAGKASLKGGTDGLIQKSETATAQIAWVDQGEEYCWGVSKKDAEYGKQVQLVKCSDPVEKFIIDLAADGGEIRPEKFPNDCVDAPTAHNRAPLELQIWPCAEVKIPSHIKFTWGVSNPGMVHLAENLSRCINVPKVPAETAHDGLKLQLWNCGPGAATEDKSYFKLVTGAPPTTTPTALATTTTDNSVKLPDPADMAEELTRELGTTTTEPQGGGGWGWFR
mmetsp:Transcript_5834/g.11749  ORF Transcript_5834/g.11749 Transcript_5834/m.11749 type:complete len:287 (+) Transcript_5834:89-949(+)